VFYAGGGGATGYILPSFGGAGGGGNGGWYNAGQGTNTAGTANTGGGGGAGFDSTGSSGGSGIVIIRYPENLPPITTVVGNGYQLNYAEGYQIYTFTSSATIYF